MEQARPVPNGPVLAVESDDKRRRVVGQAKSGVCVVPRSAGPGSRRMFGFVMRRAYLTSPVRTHFEAAVLLELYLRVHPKAATRRLDDAASINCGLDRQCPWDGLPAQNGLAACNRQRIPAAETLRGVDLSAGKRALTLIINSGRLLSVHKRRGRTANASRDVCRLQLRTAKHHGPRSLIRECQEWRVSIWPGTSASCIY